MHFIDHLLLRSIHSDRRLACDFLMLLVSHSRLIGNLIMKDLLFHILRILSVSWGKTLSVALSTQYAIVGSTDIVLLLFSLLVVEVLLLALRVLVLNGLIKFSLAVLAHGDILLVWVFVLVVSAVKLLQGISVVTWWLSSLIVANSRRWLVLSVNLTFLASSLQDGLSSSHLHIPLSDVVLLQEVIL